MKPLTCMTTSWDDGHPLDFRLADMLEANGLRATFYIPESADTGTMGRGDVRHLSERFDIGAHTIHHTFLDTVDEKRAAAEIIDSKAWVEHITGRPCDLFCPPAGKHSERDLRLIRQAGYVGLRTVELMSTDAPRERDGLLIMPTTVHAFPHPAKSYVKNALKRRSPHNLWRYVVNGHMAGWDEQVERQLESVARHGGVFHLWGHSWELEETAQWERLAAVLAVMGRYTSRVPCLTNAQVCQTFRSATASSALPVTQ